MRLMVPLGLATGLALIYWGIAVDRPGPESPRRERLGRYLGETGWGWLDERAFILAIAGSGTVGFAIVLALTANPILATLSGGAALSLPPARVRARRIRRRKAGENAWPDALASLVSGIRSGISLPECCIGLATRGPAELRPAFEAFTAAYRSSGSFEAGLARLRAELADPIADRVVVVLSMAHQVGGRDLVRVLRVTSDAVREELRIANEIRARWSWTVTAARVAAAAPYLIVGLMSLRPEGAAAYSSSMGTATLLVGTVAVVLGYRLMLRVARLPQERRLIG